jgi:hypothetical protein
MFERYKKNVTPIVTNRLKSLAEREKVCWDMAKVFLENKDAHGIHDMGVEIQALQRAITELNKL